MRAVGRALLVVGFGWAWPAFAMSIAEAGPPADFPPKGFEGTQFVDARGCIYVKTGGDGPGGWTPRVARSGEVICGLVPTFAAAAMLPESSRPPVAEVEVKDHNPLGPLPVINAPTGYPLPQGYKPAWEDGRLNPLRGPRSDSGVSK